MSAKSTRAASRPSAERSRSIVARSNIAITGSSRATAARMVGVAAATSDADPAKRSASWRKPSSLGITKALPPHRTVDQPSAPPRVNVRAP
jgi:hypothetical protein